MVFQQSAWKGYWIIFYQQLFRGNKYPRGKKSIACSGVSQFATLDLSFFLGKMRWLSQMSLWDPTVVQLLGFQYLTISGVTKKMRIKYSYSDTPKMLICNWMGREIHMIICRDIRSQQIKVWLGSNWSRKSEDSEGNISKFLIPFVHLAQPCRFICLLHLLSIMKYLRCARYS